MLLVERDDVGQRAHRYVARREVPGQGHLELDQHQSQPDLVVEVLQGRQREVVDDHRAGRRQQRQRPFGRRVGGVAVPPQVTGYADPAAAHPALELGRGTRPGHRVEQRGGVGDGQRHRPGCVLAPRDRHHPLGRHQPDRGLQPDDPAACGRGRDRAVGLGADGERGQPGGDRGPAPGARPGGSAVEGIRVAGQTAVRAPAGGGVVVADVGPLAEVGLAEHDQAGVTESAYQRCVLLGRRVGERQRAGRRGQTGGVDVVLDQHRPAVQRRAAPAGGGLAVECLGLGQRVRIDRVDGAEARVELLDQPEQSSYLVLGGS